MDIVLTLILVNALRQQPLIEHRDLDMRAQARAEQLCRDKQWSHLGYEKSFAGLKWKYAGENLAKDFVGKNAEVSAVFAWYTSPTHRDNMLNKNYKYTGLGQACGITVQLFTDSV